MDRDAASQIFLEGLEGLDDAKHTDCVQFVNETSNKAMKEIWRTLYFIVL